ncbi:MAG: hypothetical protein AW10_02132 [Candidatus Accumulibacter appositus]|uniref:Uncharacterized protein n=1 Tax=Candidatus Accumulibacter appositus TaxID=1454003 RepID=A0A011PSN4_9PROT|nr:MAG: hypothetical protein AW10_02132 [Candidatus Accumulibacter appositus]
MHQDRRIGIRLETGSGVGIGDEGAGIRIGVDQDVDLPDVGTHGQRLADQRCRADLGADAAGIDGPGGIGVGLGTQAAVVDLGDRVEDQVLRGLDQQRAVGIDVGASAHTAGSLVVQGGRGRGRIDLGDQAAAATIGVAVRVDSRLAAQREAAESLND